MKCDVLLLEPAGPIYSPRVYREQQERQLAGDLTGSEEFLFGFCREKVCTFAPGDGGTADGIVAGVSAALSVIVAVSGAAFAAAPHTAIPGAWSEGAD
ncbi:hypothetical protein chiPu_0006378 [Chiloscyllium punctatum]|uniref:Uncharacterized protein n=1 Tax=Chiloscyllium punctatum TaxID=137246 RepID=A0A401SC25_CHIPU|nr:hypothetical protein [Chiloscyllium punctatum]